MSPREYVCKQCRGPNTPNRARRHKPCEICALLNWQKSVMAMRDKTGAMYERWKRNWQAATGLTLSENGQKPNGEGEYHETKD